MHLIRSFTPPAFGGIMLIVLYLSLGVFGGESVLSTIPGQSKMNESTSCGTLTLCKDGGSNNCFSTTRKIVIYDYWSKVDLPEEDKNFNVTELELGINCQVTLCDDQELMGYCAELRAGTKVADSRFGKFLQSNSFSLQCACNERDIARNYTKDANEIHFDRNYVGVVYSPYDKYWEPTGPNGTLTAVSWNDYSDKELGISLETVSKKFSYISTFGVGTASNTSEWYEGDKISYVSKLSAEINAKMGYPALRVSVGIFRKNDVNVVWKSKELYNAIEVSKLANRIFKGTVWGITVTSQYVTDLTTAEDAIDMIMDVKEINRRDKLHLKVGIRLEKCKEFTGKKRPEDDAKVPIYLDATPRSYEPMTPFQERLQRIAKISDYILCSYIPRLEYALDSYPQMVKKLQSEFLVLRKRLQKINPNLKLFIETGVPSQGVGNGLKNNLQNFRNYWRDMSEFAQKEGIMFHMFEALDQPWKNIQDRDPQDIFGNDINAPDGPEAFYGWWRRANNSNSIYIEKALEDTDMDPQSIQAPEIDKGSDSSSSKLITVLISCFFGLILITVLLVASLSIKLRKAKREIISPAYITQFLSGGESCSTKDDNYAFALRIPYNRQYELSKEDFKIEKSAVMGSGQSAIVLRGTIKGRSESVAFKCTTPSSSVINIKSLMSEIKILSYIGEHNNILCMLGAYTKKIERGIVYLALECCPLGSLELFLRKMDTSKLENIIDVDVDSDFQFSMLEEGGCVSGVVNPGYATTGSISNDDDSSRQNGSLETTSPLSTYVLNDDILIKNSYVKWSQTTPIDITSAYGQVDIISFYKWAYQIASAMEFVSQKNVIHADLAARNVLLVTPDHVKVCDFGLSRKLYQEMGVLHDKDNPLPWRWMAPESLKYLMFSVESDVWSYGVTIWEIFSRAEVPYHGMDYDMQFAKKLESGTRLDHAKYASLEIDDLLLKCWDIVPGNRPSFSDIKHFFHSMLQANQCENFSSLSSQ